MAYTKYSLTPANNNAAPPDGAPEGMLPSAVNDTMRDMMAQIRDCGDGIRGGTYTMTAPVITGGSINNTPIGATIANTGAFTTSSLKGSTSGTITLAAAAVAGFGRRGDCAEIPHLRLARAGQLGRLDGAAGRSVFCAHQCTAAQARANAWRVAHAGDVRRRRHHRQCCCLGRDERAVGAGAGFCAGRHTGGAGPVHGLFGGQYGAAIRRCATGRQHHGADHVDRDFVCQRLLRLAWRCRIQHPHADRRRPDRAGSAAGGLGP